MGNSLGPDGGWGGRLCLTWQDLFQDGRVLDLLVSGQQQRPSYHFDRLGIIIAEGQANATVRILAFNQI